MRRKRLTETVSVYLQPEEARKIRKIADQFGLSISDVARFCILYTVNEVLKSHPFAEVMIHATTPKGETKHERPKRRR